MKTALEQFPEQEENKIQKADVLKKQLDLFGKSFFRIFRPSYWRVLGEYRRVVQSFKVGKF